MITLKGTQPIGAGVDRVVFQDPTDAKKCIKISRIDFKKEFQPIGFNEKLYWLSRAGQVKYFDFNYVDVLSADILKKNETTDTFKHLPRCYGYVDTDLGPGVAWEMITNHDGSQCKSLRDYKVAPELLSEKEKARIWQGALEFFVWQKDTCIMLREIAFTNTLVQERGDGRLRLYHIDAIGCADLIPLAKYSSFVRRLRILSKVYRFKKRMEAWLGKSSLYISF